MWRVLSRYPRLLWRLQGVAGQALLAHKARSLFVVAAVATMGLGGLILCGVGATWFMLALLVVMTAGG